MCLDTSGTAVSKYDQERAGGRKDNGKVGVEGMNGVGVWGRGKGGERGLETSAPPHAAQNAPIMSYLEPFSPLLAQNPTAPSCPRPLSQFCPQPSSPLPALNPPEASCPPTQFRSGHPSSLHNAGRSI